MDNQSTFKAELPRLHAMLSFVCEKLHEFGIKRKELLEIEVALEEVIVNIINHAYQGEVGDIEIGYERSQSGVTISIKDFGIPFNPLTYKKEYDTTLPLEDRSEGGIGIHMIKEFIDDIHYSRNGSVNELTLTKKLTTPS